MDGLSFDAIQAAALDWLGVLKVPAIAIMGISLALFLAERVVGFFIRPNRRPPVDGEGG